MGYLFLGGITKHCNCHSPQRGVFRCSYRRQPMYCHI